MESLPVELWTRIFRLACVDGGRMGCVLAEVSRYFRDAVLPVQLHSVVLLGYDKMSIFFTRVLQTRPPGHRRVLHLFLASAPGTPPSATPSSPMREDQMNILQGILVSVGPELRTLTTLLPQYAIDRTSVLCNAFPRLEELTTTGFFSSATSSAPLQASFPSLTRLHALSVWDTATLTLYTARAPQLKHLRISAVWSMTNTLLDGLGYVLRAEDMSPEELFDPRLLPFPVSLENIIIVLDAEAGIRMGPDGFVAVANLQAMDSRGKLAVYYGKKPFEVDVAAVQRDWNDRMLGGDGCWSGPGQDALKLNKLTRVGVGAP
jgi:hypothetical protein